MIYGGRSNEDGRPQTDNVRCSVPKYTFSTISMTFRLYDIKQMTQSCYTGAPGNQTEIAS